MNVLLATPTAIVRDEDTPINIMDSGQYNDGSQDWWLYLCTQDHSGLYPGSKIIGQWNADGSVLVTDRDDEGNPTDWYPIDPDYEAHIRPLGNAEVTQFDEDGNPISTVEGVATKELRYHSWLGGGQRNLQDQPAPETRPEYPADEQPIALTMERFWYDVAPWEGWAWRATIEFSDPNRPPNARAIGIYNDSWVYQYTTGAFVWTDTGEVDGEGNPIFKWQTETPAGRATPEKEPVYYALLFGSLQEGRMVLEPEVDSRLDNYWENNQSGAAAIESGVDLLYYENVVMSYEQEGLTYG